jgi:hypothetical protein
MMPNRGRPRDGRVKRVRGAAKGIVDGASTVGAHGRSSASGRGRGTSAAPWRPTPQTVPRRAGEVRQRRRPSMRGDASDAMAVFDAARAFTAFDGDGVIYSDHLGCELIENRNDDEEA